MVQGFQQGLTLRPLEALKYRRKLVTNYRPIVNENFYHPNNVFLIDDNLNLDGIEEFMSRPFHECSREALKLHTSGEMLRACFPQLK